MQGICDVDSAQSWLAENGLTIVQAALGLISAAGNTPLTATGKMPNIDWVEEWHRHRRRLKSHKKKPYQQLDQKPNRKSNLQNWTVWAQKQHETYMTRSTYAPFLRGPDSSKGEDLEVSLKCCRCGMEKLEKNPVFTG